MATDAQAVKDLNGGRGDAAAPNALVETRGIAKTFAGVAALQDVDLDIRRGEVHGLVGANGAGKSTLIRSLAGIVVPDAGTIRVDGQELRLGSPQASEKAGLAFIHQELNLVPHFNVIENILLGVPKVTRLGLIDWEKSSLAAREAAKRVGITFRLDTQVSELSVAERWLVMISKALVRKASLIAMDEPTASLSEAEAKRLFTIIRDLSRSGVAILYVSHRLDEILDLCDRITVFRDGKVSARATRGDLDKRGLVRAIVGRELEKAEVRSKVATSGLSKPLFSAINVSCNPRVKDVSLDLFPGEILGLGGLVGSGRTEFARLAFGADQLSGGHFELAGEPVSLTNTWKAINAGIAMVLEERRTQGLMLQHTVGFNINIATLKSLRTSASVPWLSARKMRDRAQKLIGQLHIKTSNSSQKISELSGGNQQKAVIARWLNDKTKVLILDEPSRGVDVGARAEIYDIIRALASRGIGVIVISSDVEELALLADRVVVMHEGRNVGDLKGSDISERSILELSYLESETHERENA